jgi:hypothetical protein
MNEENKPEHPADKLLGADWHDPIRDLQANAWADLSDSERERLEKLWRERDEKGARTWEQGLEPDPDDPEFVLLMLRPVDPRDPRPPEQVGRWLVKAMTVPLERAQAIVEEHRDEL